jgi:two-component system chemotaxis response regulator CheY
MRTPDPRTERARPPLRILTADPDSDARAVYRQAFGVAEYDVIEASDGRDALVKAFVRVPALVITELRLPVMDGLAVCEILRRDRATATVPIVIATTENRPSEIERARQVANVVLAKPAPSEVLLTECARLLGRVHSLRGVLAELSDTVSEPVGISATVLRIEAELRQGRKGRPAARTHVRFTTTAPPFTPPALTCPSCERALTYELSYVGGVSERHPEQWDYFICATCGTFQHRQRTRKIRRLTADEEQWMQRLRAKRHD